MGALLYIPWFRLEKFDIPLPFPIFGLDAIPLQPFGILVAIGVLTSLRIAESYARRNHWSPAVASDLFTHTIMMGFAGAIVLNSVFYYPAELWDMITGKIPFRMLGLSSYGGFFGAIVGVWLWKKRRKLPLMPIADASAFSFPFGWFFGRMGCFVVHDHPGRATDFFLAVDEYRVGPPPFEPRHDLGFYEVLWSFACGALFLYLARQKRPAGFYVALLPLLYAPIRFFLDFLRAGSDLGGDVRYGGLTPGQYSSIAFLVLGAIMLRKVLTQPEPPMPPEVAWPPIDVATTEKPSDRSTKKRGAGV
ncbi:MAG: prolipoprotein diacylglyceryl transferase [Polyangiaceae bacterium]|nr:prolipoprotein diacylglyceryl transferase [Polyangiaceae bacterium]